MNHKLDEALSCLRMASTAGREGGFFIFEGNAVMCSVTIRTECAPFISKIYSCLSVIIFQVGCLLREVAGTTDFGGVPARFQP